MQVPFTACAGLMMAGLAMTGLAMTAPPAAADNNPAAALSDVEIALLQQAAQGCEPAYEALRGETLSLIANCPAPSTDPNAARILIESGRLNGMVQACGYERWSEHSTLPMAWAAEHDADSDETYRSALFNAGFVYGFVSVQDGRAATACVDGDDFSIHYYGNHIYPLMTAKG